MAYSARLKIQRAYLFRKLRIRHVALWNGLCMNVGEFRFLNHPDDFEFEFGVRL